MPLCIAISNDVRDNFGYTPLHWAAMYGNVEIIKLLLGKTPNVDAVDNFESKLSEVARERLSFLQHYGNIVNEVNGKSKLTPFEEAIDSGNYILVKKFLNQIDDLNKINDHGHTILHRAVIKRHRLTVEFLLEKSVKLDTLDKCNSSVLHWAAMIGDAEIVQILIKWNVEVNVIDNFGDSSLAVAAMNAHLEVLSLLLKEGGEANIVDKCGNSPLDWACKKDYIQCVEVLLENGAVAKSLQEEDLLDLAKEQRTFLKRAALY
ncbi:inversin-like [Zophobas morio]|uniref:inversin-like n=1 Tax=Zophobas morio TaxID=2755281 RepID=UPI0030830FCC